MSYMYVVYRWENGNLKEWLDLSGEKRLNEFVSRTSSKSYEQACLKHSCIKVGLNKEKAFMR